MIQCQIGNVHASCCACKLVVLTLLVGLIPNVHTIGAECVVHCCPGGSARRLQGRVSRAAPSCTRPSAKEPASSRTGDWKFLACCISWRLVPQFSANVKFRSLRTVSIKRAFHMWRRGIALKSLLLQVEVGTAPDLPSTNMAKTFTLEVTVFAHDFKFVLMAKTNYLRHHAVGSISQLFQLVGIS